MTLSNTQVFNVTVIVFHDTNTCYYSFTMHLASEYFTTLVQRYCPELRHLTFKNSRRVIKPLIGLVKW